jgi:hypothetical protein
VSFSYQDNGKEKMARRFLKGSKKGSKKGSGEGSKKKKGYSKYYYDNGEPKTKKSKKGEPKL